MCPESNAEECAMRTNPCHPDADGDGVDDFAETAQGSDPNDASDGGVPGSRVPVSFTFGDHSGSHSEKYTLNVMPVSGSGSRPSSFAWLNENYGVCETNIVNNAWAQNGLVNTAVGAQIRNVLSNTGGVEVYFIPGNGANTEPVGSNTDYGIIIRCSANARTLAHEIGHACGWADIYIREGRNGPIPEELNNRVRRDWMPDDWSGGGNVGGFYETVLRQYELISRLLMYGVKSDAKADIPAGSVYGWASDGASGNMNVGRNGMLTYPPYNL